LPTTICILSAYLLHTFCNPSAFASAEGLQKVCRWFAEEVHNIIGKLGALRRHKGERSSCRDLRYFIDKILKGNFKRRKCPAAEKRQGCNLFSHGIERL
jgi:hypothetical protein